MNITGYELIQSKLFETETLYFLVNIWQVFQGSFTIGIGGNGKLATEFLRTEICDTDTLVFYLIHSQNSPSNYMVFFYFLQFSFIIYLLGLI